MAWFSSLVVRAEREPHHVFVWLVALHLVLWTLLPTLISSNAPLDVIEGYAWGREWLIGTYKHPPMQAWLLEIAARLTARAAWAHFFLSQLCVITAFWAVWRLGLRMMNATQALIGVALLQGIIYYNFTSPEFNPNVLQLPFWALVCLSAHRAFKENKLADWLLLGVWGAAGLYSKYSTGLLLFSLGVFTLLQADARQRLKNVGPYLATAVCLALFLPHLLWLQAHDFQSLHYFSSSLYERGGASRYVTFPSFVPLGFSSALVFLVGQIINLLPAVLLYVTLKKQSPLSTPPTNAFDRAFLATLLLTPLAITLGIAVVMNSKIQTMWAAPFFNLLGLWVLARCKPRKTTPAFIAVWLGVFTLALCAYAGSNIIAAQKGKDMRVHFAGKNLAQQIETAWSAHTNAPLHYVLGDTWLAGNIAFYASSRPHLFINADVAISPWIDEDDVRHKGGVIVWCEDRCRKANPAPPVDLMQKFPAAIVQPPAQATMPMAKNAPPVMMGWAIVPPER